MTRRKKFQPSAPGTTLWIIAIVIGGLGILAHYAFISELSRYNYELLLIAFLLLVFGTANRNM